MHDASETAESLKHEGCRRLEDVHLVGGYCYAPHKMPDTVLLTPVWSSKLLAAPPPLGLGSTFYYTG